MDGSRAHPAVMTVILALRAHGAITLACLNVRCVRTTAGANRRSSSTGRSSGMWRDYPCESSSGCRR